MRTLPLVSLTVVSAAAVGIGGPLLDASAGPWARALGAALVAGWCYAAIPFCLGMAGTSKVKAAVVGTTALLITVVLYYSTKAAQGDFRTVDLSETSGREFFSWGQFAGMTLYWCLAGLILGPPLGLAGRMARQGAIRLPFQLLVPVITLAETMMRLQVEASMASSPVVWAWESVRATSIALIVLLIGVAAWKKAQSSFPRAT
ncbi:hypothetical protein [Streptomyces nodosus]|uniref:hypothetical protein n=1 Tax=Streptomyces nodosus TaxID=40318 RepID=UPI0006933E2B|nr:hypothetical protein [Streptomyces nodosus]MBB4793438.1 hypothetical protein [Streptomyces nodosus]